MHGWQRMLHPIWHEDCKSMVESGPWFPLLKQTLDPTLEVRGKSNKADGKLQVQHRPSIPLWKQTANPRSKPNLESYYGEAKGKSKVQKEPSMPFWKRTAERRCKKEPGSHFGRQIANPRCKRDLVSHCGSPFRSRFGAKRQIQGPKYTLELI